MRPPDRAKNSVMRIGLCKSSVFGPISGADEIMLNYAVHLHQAQQDVVVVLLYPPTADDPYLRRLKVQGVRVVTLMPRSYLLIALHGLRQLSFSILSFLYLVRPTPKRVRKIWKIVFRMIVNLHYRRFRKSLQREKLDILHVFTPDSGAAMLIRGGHELGIPVLYHEMGTPHHMPMLAEHYVNLEKVLPLCTEMAALSPRLAAEWSLRFSFLDSVSVLPLIVEASNHRAAGVASVNGDRVVFGFAARLEPGKGPLVLMDAMDRLQRAGVPVVARVAGKGPQSLEVKARARALKLGEMCEFVNSYAGPRERAAFMNSVDVMVLPSLAEGTPNTIIEAMAHGIPVIASWVGGIPDIVSADCGILVPPGDAEALAHAMELLATDPQRRQAMGAASRQRSEKLFSPRTVVPLMLQTYARVTRNGHEFAPFLAENRAAHPWMEPEVSA